MFKRGWMIGILLLWSVQKDLESQLHSPYFTIYLRNESALAAVLWTIFVPSKKFSRILTKKGVYLVNTKQRVLKH